MNSEPSDANVVFVLAVYDVTKKALQKKASHYGPLVIYFVARGLESLSHTHRV